MKSKLITSSVNHNIRVDLSLTMEEYAVLDVMLSAYTSQPFDFVVFATAELGFDTRSVINSLIEKKMIFISRNNFLPVFIISEKWISQFDFDFDFEEFFIIFKSHGNKIAAKAAYQKVRKIVDRDTLHESAARFIEFNEQNSPNWIYVTKAQTWLDVKSRRWEDRLPGEDTEDATNRLVTSYM